MKKIVLLIAGLFLFSGVAVAGPGHEHGHGHSHGPVSETKVIERAAQKVKQLVDAGKLPESWKSVAVSKAEQKTYANGPEWVVTFNNPADNREGKQMLYVFYSLDGHYIAANHTGE